MFSDAISHPLLQVSSEAFNRIASNYLPFREGLDHSLDIVLRYLAYDRPNFRALVYRRPPVEVQRHINPHDATLDDRNIRRIFVELTETSPGSLNVLDLGRGDYKEALLAMLDRSFDRALRKAGLPFVRAHGVELFLKKHSSKEFRVYFGNDRTVVFAESTNLPVTQHAIASIYPALVPSLFREHPLNEKEKEVLGSLLDDRPDKFLSAIDSFYLAHDFKAEAIRKAFKGFGQVVNKTKLDGLNHEIDCIDRDIRSYEDAIRDLFLKREKKCFERMGLDMTVRSQADTPCELEEFFVRSRVLDLIQVDGAEVTFEVRAPLDNFDPDVFDKYRRNRHSIFFDNDVYDQIDGIDKAVDVLPLIDAIFDKQTVRVYMKSRFSLDFMHNSWDNIRVYSEFLRDATLNPHLTYYHCLGNNLRTLEQALRDNDYLTAVTTVISVTGNLNLCETQNVARFMRDLFNCNGRPCELPDGRLVTAYEALAWATDNSKN